MLKPMRSNRSRAFAALATVGAVAMGASLLPVGAAFAQGTCCVDISAPEPGAPPNEVYQEFEYEGNLETAWRVQYAQGTSQGLYITGAWFKPGPQREFVQVLNEARVAEIFVVYHPGSPRYYDLGQFNFPMVPSDAGETGCCGEVLDGVVVKEVRTRGLLWKDDKRSQVAQELVLWAVIDAANYNYMFEYVFRDDGTIELAVGATARNLPGNESTAHMHTGAVADRLRHRRRRERQRPDRAAAVRHRPEGIEDRRAAVQ